MITRYMICWVENYLIYLQEQYTLKTERNLLNEIININKYVDITVYNALGDIVIHKTNTNALDVSRLSPGIYNLQIMCNNKLVNKTIIKK